MAVSAETREKQQMMIDRIAAEGGDPPTFIMLQDEAHRVIDRYGIFNEASAEDRPIPHPTTLVIDRDGIVRWRMTEVNYKIRPENADIVAALRALERPARP